MWSYKIKDGRQTIVIFDTHYIVVIVSYTFPKFDTDRSNLKDSDMSQKQNFTKLLISRPSWISSKFQKHVHHPWEQGYRHAKHQNHPVDSI